MQKIKVNDEVIVTAGKDKGKTGTVKKLNWKNNTVTVEGVNVMKKAIRPTEQNPNGGFAEFEKPIHRSNVSLVSPKTGKATRVRIEEKDGKKVRVATACGTVLN